MALESLRRRINIKDLQIQSKEAHLSPTMNLHAAASLFEHLARKTWDRIKFSVAYDVSQGEETITDINLLEIAMARLNEVKVWKCPKNEEPYTGIDWEWWIGSDRLRWLRYAVQAKKLNPISARYDNLGHKVGSTHQIEILKSYAKDELAIPLYCFYNSVNEAKYDPYWWCALDIEAEQLGCSVTPLSVAEAALTPSGRKSRRTFRHIHSNNWTLPWRCLVRCEHFLKVYDWPDDFEHEALGHVHFYPKLPPKVAQLFAAEDQSNVGYVTDSIYRPKKVMAVTIEERTGSDEPPKAVKSVDHLPLPEIRNF